MDSCSAVQAGMTSQGKPRAVPSSGTGWAQQRARGTARPSAADHTPAVCSLPNRGGWMVAPKRSVQVVTTRNVQL